MGLGLELKIPLFSVGAVIVVEGALDIDRVGVMALDQVAVVAVHRPDERRQGVEDRGGEAAFEVGGPFGQLKGEFCRDVASGEPFAQRGRFHGVDILTVIPDRPFVRVDVRFRVRFPEGRKSNRITKMVNYKGRVGAGWMSGSMSALMSASGGRSRKLVGQTKRSARVSF